MNGKEGDQILIECRTLEQDTGFLVHVFMTYENLRPFLKGFYLSLNEWRYDRDAQGWKMGRTHWEDIAEELWEDPSTQYELAKECFYLLTTRRLRQLLQRVCCRVNLCLTCW